MATPLRWLGQNLTLGHVGEFVLVSRALAPFALILASLEGQNMLK